MINFRAIFKSRRFPIPDDFLWIRSLESEFKTGLVLTLYNFQMGLEISNHCASINTILVSIVFGETIFHSK